MYDNHECFFAYGCHTTINHDQIGNPFNWRNVSSFTWSGRQLDSAVLSNSIGIAYTYNSDGIRTRRVIEGSYVYDYVLDGTKILCETVTSNGTEIYKYYYLYDEKGSIIGFQDGTNTYYYQKNLQGDIIRILNAEGAVLVEYTYNAFGEVLSVTGSHASTLGQRNPFRYRGYYYDSETGFYYLNSRYYDPTVGRFLNADGIVSNYGSLYGNNMFAYCFNNPIALNDASGYWPKFFDEFVENVVDTFNSAKSFLNQNALNKDGSYSLFDNGGGRYGNRVWHEQIFAFNSSFLSYSSSDECDTIGLGSHSFDFYTGGWEWDDYDLSLFDFGHAEASFEINTRTGEFCIGAYASVWSPSFGFEAFGKNIEVGFDLGVGWNFGVYSGKFEYDQPGFSFTIS